MAALFSTSFFKVLIMLAYALPGFLFIKFKKLEQTHIKSFNNLLIFVCQPFLVLYSFKQTPYEKGMGINLLIFGIITFLFQALVITSIYLIFKKKCIQNPKYRILSVASAFGNVGFFGIPLIEAILPNEKGAVIYAAVYLLGMNAIAWTLASFIITNDKKHFSIVKLLFNPTTVPLVLALPMFFTRSKYPILIDDAISILGKVSIVISMIIIGMRLGLIPLKNLFNNKIVYFTIIIKQILFPLLVLGISLIFRRQLGQSMIVVIFVLACAPVASLVLNFSEHHGEGAEYAAPTVLLSTISSILTIPIMLLILPLVFPGYLKI